MEERELEYFCEWLCDNNIMISEDGKGRKLFRTSIIGSKLYTTEQLVKKYCNEESL